ncbi:hypothetical protein [Moorella sp. Hama-1]|uniref:hypothetical protein n=1 Tax=Moorella sp. Hama-1 TaxID=2138101 RepID=UPI000D64A919|nr:hypothetical protein [Moorella sp. Hama-1]
MQILSFVENLFIITKKPDKLVVTLIVLSILKRIEPGLFDQFAALIFKYVSAPLILLSLKIACVCCAIYGFLGCFLFFAFLILQGIEYFLETKLNFSNNLTVPNWVNGTFNISSVGFLWMWILYGFLYLFGGSEAIPTLIKTPLSTTDPLVILGLIISFPFAMITLLLFSWVFLYDLVSIGGVKPNSIKITVVDPLIIKQPITIRETKQNQS